jgi:perosamine synthetase
LGINMIKTTEFIPLFTPDIRQEDADATCAVLLSGQLVQGPNVEQLEKWFQNRTGTDAAAAASNGTATLHLILTALGIGAGDEVILPAFSYIATANVVELVGATPVFVDILLDTFNINPEGIESRINSKTKAIIVVHEFGLSAHMEPIMAIAKKFNLPVIEDAACAIGATYNGISVGSFGIASSFSLHPRKAITSGEGGVITSNDIELINKIKILRNHGTEIIDGVMEFTAAGFNYRLTDFQAAMVLSQSKRLNHHIEVKDKLAQLYRESIHASYIQLPIIPSECKHSWQTFHLVLEDGIDRNKVIQQLREKGIGSNYGAQCMPAQIYYKNKYGYDSKEEWPNAYKAWTQGLAIPLFPDLTPENVKYISHSLNQL